MRPVLRRVLSVAGKLIGLRRPVIGGALERIAEGNPVLPQQKEPKSMFSRLSAIKEWFKGKKSYTLVISGILVVLANKVGLLSPDLTSLDPNDWLKDIVMLALGGTIRAGVTNAARNG